MERTDKIRKSHKIWLETAAHDNEKREYRFKIEFYVFMDGGTYISYCPSLDLSTSGDTFNAAVGNFYEMFQLYIESCVENKTLYDDLTAHGWKMRAKAIQPPTFAVQMRKPEMKRLMRGGIGYEKIVAPAHIPAFV